MIKCSQPNLAASNYIVVCLLVLAFFPTAILGNEPNSPDENVRKANLQLPPSQAANAGDGVYWDVVGFSAWSDTDPGTAKARVVELIKKIDTSDEQDWRIKWLAAWSYEIDLVSELTPYSRERFVGDLKRSKEILIQIPTVADREQLEADLSKCISNVMKVIDNRCPSHILMLEFRAFAKSSNGVTKELQDIYARIRDERARFNGTGGPIYASDSENVALCAMELGDLAGARDGLTRCLGIREKSKGVPASLLQQTRLNLAVLDVKSGRYAEAIPRITEMLSTQEISATQGNLVAAVCYHQLGLSFAGTAQLAKAEESFEKGLNEYRKMLHPVHPIVLRVMSDQAAFYESAAQLEKAKETRSEIESLKIKWKVIGKST